MATTSHGPDGQTAPAVEYPTRDGRPLGETEIHRCAMVEVIALLQHWFAGDPLTHVSGNLMLYYVLGDSRRHVSPDVQVTRRIAKLPQRKLYLVWEEGRAPDLVIEVTSKSTRKEDQETKFELYRDVLRVAEYFLFDPEGEYLRPRLKGYRLTDSEYVPIEAVDGRLPSDVTGLHLQASGLLLMLFDPQTQTYLLTAEERAQRDSLARVKSDERADGEARARQKAEERAQRDSLARVKSDERADGEARARQKAEERAQRSEERAQCSEENERQLQAEIERLRGTRPPGI